MILSIHQPAYLPWLGYFHKINLSDTFIYFDTTQFEKNSFINRNKIKTPSGPIWLTVPVKLEGHLEKEIGQIELASKKWGKKHWLTIESNYKKAKYWPEYADQLWGLYKKEYNNIADLCYDQLVLFLSWLNIKTKVIRSSELKPRQSKKLDLVLDILEEVKASSYISGALGRDYIEPQRFKDKKIKLYYQSYEHPKYNQLWGDEFSPYMSIIDLLFNEGDGSLEILMSGNITKQDLSINPKLYEH